MLLFFGWDPGVIGEFGRLSELRKANQELIQELADSIETGVVGRAVAAGTLKWRDLTAADSPIDTGTLRSAHRARVEPMTDGVVGTIYIDPFVTNPVYGGRPAVYGEIVHERDPWFDRSEELYGDMILEEVEQTIVRQVEDLWP